MSMLDLEKNSSVPSFTTKDGREVIIAGYNPDAEDFERILGWIKNPDGWYSQSWFSDGKTTPEIESEDDLIIK